VLGTLLLSILAGHKRYAHVGSTASGRESVAEFPNEENRMNDTIRLEDRKRGRDDHVR
jgi:hypothetical protein